MKTFAVLIAEWVIGDQGMTIRLGDHVSWHVRPAEANDEETAASPLVGDRVAAGQLEVPIYVLHADDPEPPNSVEGRVTVIQALQWSHPPDGEHRLLSQRTVPEARINWAVDHYLIQVEGTVGVRH